MRFRSRWSVYSGILSEGWGFVARGLSTTSLIINPTVCYHYMPSSLEVKFPAAQRQQSALLSQYQIFAIDVLNVKKIIINVNKRVYYETITNVSKR